MASMATFSCCRRPLGFTEYFFALTTELNIPYSLAYTWQLESKSPLSVDLIHQAAALLQEIMPLLRLCVVKELDGKYFFELKDTVTVPLEVSNETDWRKEQDEMMKVVYNLKTGPLWKMRFLPTVCRELALGDTRKEGNPYKSAVIFGIDHVLTDGFTNMSICRQFLKILNGLIDGGQPDKTPHTKIDPSLVDLMPQSEKAFGWMDYLVVAKFIWNTMFSKPKPNIFAVRYPLVDTYPSHTFSISTDGLSKEETRLLRKMCRLQQTTVNGAFTAAASTATAWMIYGRNKSQGDIQENTVAVEQTVNMRRFCETEEGKNALGVLFLSTLISVTLSPSNDNPKALWDAARSTSSQMHTIFENGDLLKQLRLANYFVQKMKAKDLRSNMKISAEQRCFAISNMGDCSGILS
ncbi:uncharacterized protein LOC106172123, partial [Lingula anatina]|uniref:Uncharacterized protein LOC106172123 n=1 Tax=Lingula anatina TaxID=7574 RepID=A0A1S3JDD0_LINAN